MKSTKKRKADCTPEEWAEHLAYHRQRRLDQLDAERAKKREYTSREDVKERRRIRDASQEAMERRRTHAQTEEAKARAKQLYEEKRNDPERWKKRLEAQRKRRTGFAQATIDQLLIAQDGKCAICFRPFDGRQIRADHCHDTNTPRGLLCHHCNIIEGMLKGMGLSPEEFAHRLIAYLKHPPALKLKDR